MMTPITVRSFAEPAVCEEEILRYAGCRERQEDAVRLMHECLAEAQDGLCYRVCAREMSVDELAFMTDVSHNINTYLSDCRGAVLFAATVGLPLDRWIARYSRVSPARALMFQAIGAERVEALCDAFCDQLAEEKAAAGLTLKNRFSPGYGDLPLSVQPRVFTILDCAKQIGLTLNDSLLMSPSKSVTAVVGIRETQI